MFPPPSTVPLEQRIAELEKTADEMTTLVLKLTEMVREHQIALYTQVAPAIQALADGSLQVAKLVASKPWEKEGDDKPPVHPGAYL